MNERRKDIRIPEHHRVEIKILSASGTEALQTEALPCETMDVSLGGARLATPWALPVGVNLELSLTLEGLPGEFLHWARVQWVREDVAGRRFQIGLQFTDATPGTRAMWRTYLEKVVAALEP